MNVESIVTVASIVAGLGSTIFAFRLQREAATERTGVRSSIPWADWLLISAVALSVATLLLLLILETSDGLVLVSRSLLASAVTLVGGYLFSALAHYRLLLSSDAQGLATNPEPVEKLIAATIAALAVASFLLTLYVDRSNL